MSAQQSATPPPARSESFQPRTWARRLGFAKPWTAYVGRNTLRIRLDNEHALPVLSISARTRRGWIWSSVLISEPAAHALDGFSHEDAQRLLEAVDREKTAALGRMGIDLQVDHDVLVPLGHRIARELNKHRYLAARDRERIFAQVDVERDRIEAAHARARNPHAAGFSVTAPLQQALAVLRAIALQGQQILEKRNTNFVKEEVARWRLFFDHCEDRPLTNEQAIAAVTFEENTLLVAAAGSGKTSTVVGKVLYALAKEIARPEEILCLAFNGKAADEIGGRIKGRLAAITAATCPIDQAIKDRLAPLLKLKLPIESRTFHSLGLKIIREKEEDKTYVSKPKANSVRLDRAIANCQSDPHFLTNWLLLQTAMRHTRPDEVLFRTKTEYLEYLRGVWQQRKKGIKREDGEIGILSLGCDEGMQSFDEVAISNWLYVMGVNFEYEAPYEEGAELLCPGKRWRPDFTYTVRDSSGERVVVHEHFGLNAEGKAPAHFDDPVVYAEQARNKKAVLRQIDARHFWTTSADYFDGTLFDKLAAGLLAAGVQTSPRGLEEVMARLEKIGLIKDNDLVGRAVSQIRQNGWTLETLLLRLAGHPEPARARLFLSIAWPVAQEVNKLLVKDKRLDYDEMIRRALVHLRKSPDMLPFKFILADEFQDTAPGRGDVMRKMLHAKEDSLFFAVGDDWQAINRFAGSDLQFFNDFGNAFSRRAHAATRCDLTQTFRSNQGIASVARSFVLKNKSQMPKKVVATDKNQDAVVDVHFYQDDREVLVKVERALEHWVAEHPPGQKPSVFLLGRYNSAHKSGLTKDSLEALNKRWVEHITMRAEENEPPSLYSTMHRSKGLQADYVIILGLFRAEHDWMCFPSEREDDPLLQLVMPAKEALPDADERRLFYVALTRAKHKVMVLAQQRYPSPYALELLVDNRDGSVLFNGGRELPPVCPKCKAALVFERYNPQTGGSFHACSDRGGCSKSWSKWPPSAPASRGAARSGRPRN